MLQLLLRTRRSTRCLPRTALNCRCTASFQVVSWPPPRAGLMSSSTTAHKFSSLEARAPEAEAELRRELLTLLDGSEVDEAWVSDALGGSFVLDRSSLEQQHAVHGNMGILDTGQSLSADLQVAPAGTAAVEPAGGGTPQPQGLYIKKIQAKRFAHKKTPQNLRRDLASCHNECSFYKNIAPLLPQEGASSVRIPRCYYAGERSFHEAESEEQLAQSEYMLVLETMTQQQQPPTGSASTGGTARPPALCQHSPLSRSEAMQSLDLLARFHAWAWNDAERLAVVRSMLLPRASYWDLPRRGEAEMHLMPEIWAAFLQSFAGQGRVVGEEAEELLSRPSVVALADRMVRLGPWIAEQIHGEDSAPWRTIVHGDYKAMNVFVPIDAADAPSGGAAVAVAGAGAAGVGAGFGAAMIDFQWTGVGLGMLDVAMHLYHSVEPAAMQEGSEGDAGGEEALLRHYHTRLTALLSEADAAVYPLETARRHYQLCLLDYGRVVMSCFWKGASAEAFAAKAARQNCSMVYREVDAAMRFVRRMDECVTAFECERERS